MQRPNEQQQRLSIWYILSGASIEEICKHAHFTVDVAFMHARTREDVDVGCPDKGVCL